MVECSWECWKCCIIGLAEYPRSGYSASCYICVRATGSDFKASSHHHARHDTDRTVLSCLVWRCELNRPDSQTGAFCFRVRRAAQCDRRTHSDAERTCLAANSHQTRLVCSACLSTAAAATQTRQAATPSRPTAHTQRRCTPRKM